MHSVLLPGVKPNCFRHPRDAPAGCSYPAPQQRSSRLMARQRQRVVRVQAAKSLYDTLGISSDASDRDIKRAYRQKALKLHPDVNKAPNAEAQFLEVKNAFQVLSDPQQRAQYDRKLRGFGGAWGGSSSSSGGFGDFGSWGSSSSSSDGRAQPKQQQDEDFYGLGDFLSEVGSSMGGWVQQQQQELSKLQQGAQHLWQQAGDRIKEGKLEDFFRDLDKELDDWQKKRSSSGKPASLWEELAAIGEEFVDFLEQGLKDDNGAGKEGSSSGGSSSFNSTARSRNPVDTYEQLKQQYDLGGSSNNRAGSGSSSSSRTSSGRSTGAASSTSSGGGSSSNSTNASPPPPPPKKSADEEIDEMLAALKQKLNKS